ncbi:MAG: hypothetical protein H7Y22_03230 [Gemmatimonadaceae bacterium]|nr:hypothetical protein [Gloeobacterales cyanobacterium ES-bin-141]
MLLQPSDTPATAIHIAVKPEDYLGEMYYRAFLADSRGPLYLSLGGQKFLPCAQWNGANGWDAGLSLPRGGTEHLNISGRFNCPRRALQASHQYALEHWANAEDRRWYERPDHWTQADSIQKAEFEWPVLLHLEGGFEQPALIARLRQNLVTLYQIERRLICQLQISLRRERGEENLLLLKRRAIPLEQVRWELEDLVRAIHSHMRSHNLHIWVEAHDITAQPDVLSLLTGNS